MKFWSLSHTGFIKAQRYSMKTMSVHSLPRNQSQLHYCSKTGQSIPHALWDCLYTISLLRLLCGLPPSLFSSSSNGSQIFFRSNWYVLNLKFKQPSTQKIGEFKEREKRGRVYDRVSTCQPSLNTSFSSRGESYRRWLMQTKAYKAVR